MDLSSVFNFVTDGSKKVSHRAFIIMMSIVLLLFIDNIFGFSFYYNNSHKVGLTQEISLALKDTSLSFFERKNLYDLRTKIINHRTIKDFLWSNVSIPTWKTFSYVIDENGKQKKYFNPFLQFLSSSFLILGLMIGVTFVGFKEYLKTLKRKSVFDDSFLVVFIKLVGINFIFYILALSITKLLSFIPIINGNPTYNYILNVFITLIILGVIVYFSRDKKGTKG